MKNPKLKKKLEEAEEKVSEGLADLGPEAVQRAGELMRQSDNLLVAARMTEHVLEHISPTQKAPLVAVNVPTVINTGLALPPAPDSLSVDVSTAPQSERRRKSLPEAILPENAERPNFAQTRAELPEELSRSSFDVTTLKAPDFKPASTQLSEFPSARVFPTLHPDLKAE